jgi:hypothetical protein
LSALVPHVRGRAFQHFGIAQGEPNAANRHLRLAGQAVSLSRTQMVARTPEFGKRTEEVFGEFWI